MPNDNDPFSMDNYVAAREEHFAAQSDPAPVAPAVDPAAPSAQDAANPGPADTTADPAAAQPQAPVPEPEQQRRARGVQKRIDELTRRAAEAERRADLLLDTHRKLVEGQIQAPRAADPPARPADAPPREEDYPGDYRAFLRAEAEYAATQRTARMLNEDRQAREREQSDRQQQEQQQRQMGQVREVLSDFDARKEAFVKEAPDYDVAIQSLDEIPVGPHNAAMVQTLLLRPDSARVLYHLGRNPQEAHRISRMPPALQGAAIGEFAASVNRAPQPSNAPPPGRAVSGMRPPSGGMPATGSMDDYATWRKRQMRA